MHPSRGHLTLITLLLVSSGFADSIEMNVDQRLADSSDPRALDFPVESPYWEYILREFLFKTISPPPPGNNALYKELLEAPFYGGPFPAARSLTDAETAQVLSRGDVYHLAKGGWIICQEGCVECEICTVQRTLTVPTVMWILRRIRRRVPFVNSKRTDLQLTVLPQADKSFHMKNLSPGSYVYVTSNNEVLAGFKDALIRQTAEIYSLQYPFGTTKSPQSNTPIVDFSSGKDKDEGLDQREPLTEQTMKGLENKNEVFPTESQLRTTPTLVPETQTKTQNFPANNQRPNILHGGRNQRRIDDPNRNRKRVIFHPKPIEGSTPFTPFYPPTTPTVESIDANCSPMDKGTRLILGKDQFGEKHVVHIVPAGDLDAGIRRESVYPWTEPVYRQSGQSHPVDTSQSTNIEYEDHPLYRKIFRRVVDSLNTHRNAIEKFLFSTKRGAHSGHKIDSITPDRTFHKEENAENKMLRTADAEKADKRHGGDGVDNDSRSATDSGEEMIGYNAETSTTFMLFEENNNVATEGHHNGVQVTENTTQDKNSDPPNSDEQNSAESLSDKLMRQQNKSETLILKEVAKSVVNHPETLQGFNSITNSNLYPDSDDPVPTTSEGTIQSTEYPGRREKSRRHI